MNERRDSQRSEILEEAVQSPCATRGPIFARLFTDLAGAWPSSKISQPTVTACSPAFPTRAFRLNTPRLFP
jgi:hypothetical protein